MHFAVLVTNTSEYKILTKLFDSSKDNSSIEMFAISHFVPTWIMNVKGSSPVAQVVIDTLLSFMTVEFVIAKEEVDNVNRLVNKIKPLSHHLLPGLVATCDAANVREMCTILQPYTMLETCLLLIRHMQAPHSLSEIPKKQFVDNYRKTSVDNMKKVERECNKEPEIFIAAILLPRSAVTFLIGGKGHSIARIRQQTSATIKIHPDTSTVKGKDEPQKVEIAAPTRAELARAQRLVQTRLSLRQQQQQQQQKHAQH